LGEAGALPATASKGKQNARGGEARSELFPQFRPAELSIISDSSKRNRTRITTSKSKHTRDEVIADV
jgi:hypothetical protein